ncbi:MAG: class II aldolase/adducin family protein [Oscillospiraceae bacterium]|nr:class II aldolase/adducin family protein [Oscillospiraceae bacterium]
MSLDCLVEMSNRYGADEQYVLLGGGNTSYKDGNVMYVKGSGTPLATIAADEFVAMDLQLLRDTLSFEYPAEMSAAEIEAKSFDLIMDARLSGQEAKRPSVESILHALFPYKYVLHVHPTLVNGLTCSVNGEQEMQRLFGEASHYPAVWVLSKPPGPGLARELAEVLTVTGGRNPCEGEGFVTDFPKLAFLQNHGIFIAADSVGEIDDIMAYVMDKLTACVTEFPDFTDVPPDVDTLELMNNPLTPEQALYFLGSFRSREKDVQTLILNACKIAVYAKSFGGANPLGEDVVKTMLEFNPYK